MSRLGDHALASPGGWLLVGLIVLISAVVLAMAGTTSLLTEHLRLINLRRHQTQAIYLAQAGIMQAIYDFRFDGPGSVDGQNIRLGEYPVPADTGAPGTSDDDVFILGGEAADFLLIAMIPGSLATTNAGGSCGSVARHRLENWTLRNVLQSSTPPDGMPISFSQMAVSWNPVGPGEGPVRIDLGGSSADWRSAGCAPVASGVPIPLPQQTIVPGAPFWGTNRVWFATTTMHTKTWIELAVTLSDGSIRRARFLPANPTGSSASFTIKAVGEVRRGQFPFVAWRRLQAEYRLNDADPNVSNLQEIGRIASDPSPVGERPGFRELSRKQP